MIRVILSLIGLLNFCDWVIAFFIAGTAAKVEGKDGRRTSLATGLMLFFTCFGLWRLAEFVNLIMFTEYVSEILRAAPKQFSVQLTLIYGLRTLSVLFFWFVITTEKTRRQGILSGNVIRNWLDVKLDRLR